MPPTTPHVDIIGQILFPAKEPRQMTRSERKAAGQWQDGPFNAARCEQLLWQAVITQAMTDAINQSRKPQHMKQRVDAIRWLCDSSEEFIEVCSRAELDHNIIRIHAKRVMANPSHYRTEAGKSARYHERKAMRERRKQKAKETAESEPSPSPHVICGPWAQQLYPERAQASRRIFL